MPCSLVEISQFFIDTAVVVQGFSAENMRPWKAHWDRQLYKALEHQFLLGLEALNENLPEIKVELTYRYCLLLLRLFPLGGVSGPNS